VDNSTAEIESSSFFEAAVSSLERCLRGSANSQVDRILCYGLGSFSNCLVARHQLGFLLALRVRLQVSHVQIYDPLFTADEKSLLSENFKCSVIDFNEEGKRRVSAEGCTLLFAPHCPKQLTNNFLWANWTPASLSNCIVLGNSFSSILNNPASLPDTAEYLVKVNPYTSETGLANSFRLGDVFNDLAFHSFDLSKAPSCLWSPLPAPIYPDDDTGKVIKNGQRC